MHNPREQDGTALKSLGPAQEARTHENEDAMETSNEWTLVTKKPRKDSTAPQWKKPVTAHSDCTLDTPREHAEPHWKKPM
jgi:hypothetical protein